LVIPQFSYIHTATITGDNQATIKVYVDTAADILSYRIIRSETNQPGSYLTLASIPADTIPFFSYTDLTAKTTERSYYYKIVAVDSCGQDAFTSDVARTIYLSVTPNEDISNTLEWNDYEVWLGGVNHYRYYRSIDGQPDGMVNNVAFGSGAVNDNVSDKMYTNGVFCYYVEAYERSGNIFGFQDTSRSNEVCVMQKPIVFVPNAFHPGSGNENNEFNPFKAFVKGETFTLDIYNRWGELVFHNTDPKKGWNGAYKGSAAPEGVYVYYFKVTGTNEAQIERKGTLTLIR
jgi:gliding motility-associated-like protein